MRHPRTAAASLLAVLTFCAVAPGSSARQTLPVTIPFELATRHIIVKVTINKSRPLSFVLDTGADQAIVRLDVANELGLAMEGSVNTGGAGARTQAGKLVRNAKWSLVGLETISQDIRLALPLTELPAAMGRDVDGIIGGQFIRQFVTEIDYQRRQMTLHDAASFQYQGTGPVQIVPIEFNANNHPTLMATITPPGGQALEGRFVLDLGSGGALILHSPFVNQQQLLGTQAKTVRSIGAAGAGGQTNGRIGRMQSLRIGDFELDSPYTMFSEDKAGAFANPALAGNIGAQIAIRFHLYLDYGRKRLILEPSPAFKDPFDRAFSGVALRATGPGYHVFRVLEVLEESPATDAGIEAGDTVTAIDGVAAEQLTLSAINEMFEKPAPYNVTLRRGDRVLQVTLTPKRLV